MRGRSIGLMVAAAVMAAVGVPVVVRDGTASTSEMRAPRSLKNTSQANTALSFFDESAAFGNWWARNRRTRERRSGPGWSNRHVQRMARKRRNQARHRKACR